MALVLPGGNLDFDGRTDNESDRRGGHREGRDGGGAPTRALLIRRCPTPRVVRGRRPRGVTRWRSCTAGWRRSTLTVFSLMKTPRQYWRSSGLRPGRTGARSHDQSGAEVLLVGHTPGHLFVVHGLLERIPHDLYIVPTSSSFSANDYWLPAPGRPVERVLARAEAGRAGSAGVRVTSLRWVRPRRVVALTSLTGPAGDRE